jgi:ABC-type multidrug transport system ATPase subunit
MISPLKSRPGISSVWSAGNGAGKSTLIRLLTGLANPTSGSFSLFGDKNPKNLHTHLKDVTAMIETPALIERMSGKDNLYYACLMKGIKDPLEEQLHCQQDGLCRLRIDVSVQ